MQLSLQKFDRRVTFVTPLVMRANYDDVQLTNLGQTTNFKESPLDNDSWHQVDIKILSEHPTLEQ